MSKAEQIVWRKARAAGAGTMAVRLTDEMCGYVLSRIIIDLGLSAGFPEISHELPDFFRTEPAQLHSDVADPQALFERLAHGVPDAQTYFSCLVSLLKSRLKYANILSGQPLPTLDQVGPRSLLQYGSISGRALATFLFWRKWFFDIDNRAGQETGYLFEPVIAASVGGVPFTASKSPVKSHRDGKGRQVDCLLDKNAYEVKIRVTIAASGQGRWREELDYPIDCKASGYRPVLVVLDGTANAQLTELIAAFIREGGVAYVGVDAWKHLESLAGATMARFLDIYVRAPLARLLAEAPDSPLPEMTARDFGSSISIIVDGEELRIVRAPKVTDDDGDKLPDDVGADLPTAVE
ncbi:MAG: restriction endonuclease [Planctomycetota bacterium]|nr:restriction endonuclease [Planctomycetota bacterium]